MKSKIWIKIVFVLLIIGVLLVSSINYIVDPGNIYTKKNVKAHEYARKLFESSNGLVATGWNERLIKTTIATYSGNYDCIIIGSSHIMQISSITNTGDIKKICSRLLNLGVSGGSFEDLFVFSDIIFSNKNKPKKVFIDITPWIFKFNMDKRYQINKTSYENLLYKLNGFKKETSNVIYEVELIKNLVNLEYFITSLKKYKSVFDRVDIKIPKETYSYIDGYTEALTLQDGSHLYDTGYIIKSREEIKKIPIGGGDYKISGDIYNDNALHLFIKLIEFYQKNSIEVNFILTPYHPNIFKNGYTKPVQHINTIEEIAIQISNKYDIKLYGSFHPEKIGCKKDEFFDFMHATHRCLDKINFKELR